MRLRDGKWAVLQLVHEIEKLPGGARVGPVLLDPVLLAELLDLVVALDGGLGRVVVAAVSGNSDNDLLPLVGLERALLEGVPSLLLWRQPILAKVMYAKKACELVKEFSSSESGQLSAFNSDVFAQVIEECNTHFSQLQSLLRYNRAEVIRSLGWIKEAPLPEEIQEKLSSSEKDYSQNHSATIRSYQLEMDIDLAVDMVPPKDPYIKVRVLEDIGSVALSDQIANLARHAILFLRRTDAETYISQGLMEELTD
ncbi:hypothetical protein RHSIM_Rhsim03G0103800 [Rhododendron simsii]|uniref:DNA replication complex GINS protein PSF1 C-terminal domain-containing protein n=1 Tax=Rhododendron simsii TaxID=118357 RepID=A0A834HA95_RHOSS|nr:hypothetical protein RHSIM_Rhsim03G0103800 [Rhododendron simsii]